LNAAKKIILLLWLLVVASLGNVSASTPGASENRVWEKSFAALETRQAEPSQTAGRHQENEGAGYDNAVDSLLAADATATTSGAENAINGVRLNQQLSAQSAFNASGGLSQEAIAGADQIIPASELGNPAIPSGFGKFTTQTFDSPSGPFQVHFYQNPTTGEIWTGLDYKTVFNTPIGQ